MYATTAFAPLQGGVGVGGGSGVSGVAGVRARAVNPAPAGLDLWLVHRDCP